MNKLLGSATATLLLITAPQVAGAQALVQLASAQRLDVPFSRISQATELPDGRVIVLDNLDYTVQVIDANMKEARRLLQAGDGPGEMRYPTRLIAHPDGITLFIDRVNSRIVKATPDLKSISNYQLPVAPGCMTPVNARPLTYQYVDRQWRFYRQLPPIVQSASGKKEVGDNSPIVAFNSVCKSDTVAAVPIRNPDELTVGLNGVSVVPREVEPFSKSAQWALSPLGALIVVEAEPYQVHLIRPGSADIVRRINYDPVPLTNAHKVEWREAKSELGSAMITSRDGSPTTMAKMASPWTEPRSWPAKLPPFTEQALIVSLDGNVWIRRTTAVGAPSTYDVIDAGGNHLARVSLQSRGRIVAVGRRFAYSAKTDDDGVQWLERYPLAFQAPR